MSENASNSINASAVTTNDGPNDPYDHAISLIDATVAQESDNDTNTETPPQGWRDLARNATKESVRQQLARRKYAKWRQDRYPGQDVDPSLEQDGAARPRISRNNSAELLQKASNIGEVHDTTDFAEPSGMNVEDHQHVHDKTRKKQAKRQEEPYEIDILYENQRGLFFCGIPLYSHSSLLNFDPSAWVSSDLKDSAVNITNAQVPDPSWVWAWKSWYVDMSYDVDEEGWQYSFSFSNQFGWHGTHPWFHSFVRRRRWLRKRVKRHLPGQGKTDTMAAAHKLNTDYFTIHSKRDRSPASGIDDPTKTARPESFISMDGKNDDGQPPEDIRNIPSLLKSLRLASIDRAKIIAIRKFVEQGGDELVYLKDHIPTVMSFLVFQNSRRQLLAFLKQTAADAQKHRDEHEAEAKPEGDAEARRIDNLLSAVEAADAEIKGLEYWSDRKHVLKTTDDDDNSSEAKRESKIEGDQAILGAKLQMDSVDDIKGISKKAEIEKPEDTELPEELREQHEKASNDKGKGKDTEYLGLGNVPPRLGKDQVFIADRDGNS